MYVVVRFGTNSKKPFGAQSTGYKIGAMIHIGFDESLPVFGAVIEKKYVLSSLSFPVPLFLTIPLNVSICNRVNLTLYLAKTTLIKGAKVALEVI